MTQTEFITGYAERSGLTREQYDSQYVALPCDCPDEDCPGWASVRRRPDAILEHLRVPFAPAVAWRTSKTHNIFDREILAHQTKRADEFVQPLIVQPGHER